MVTSIEKALFLIILTQNHPHFHRYGKASRSHSPRMELFHKR